MSDVVWAAIISGSIAIISAVSSALLAFRNAKKTTARTKQINQRTF